MSWPSPLPSATTLPPQRSRLGAGLRPALGAVAAMLFFAAALPAQPEQAKPGYAGSETCSTCHEDIAKAFGRTPHQAIDKKRGWETKACESCHGPGSKHAESASADDIRNPAKLAASDQDKTCLTCHRNQPTHVGRVRAGHARSQVSCNSCHTVHQTPDALVARKAVNTNQQCARCHTSTWAEFQRPHSHRLAEGAMSCVDCHNPHGSFLPKSLQTVSANEPGCLKCHGDKRGPFPYDHAPVKLEGCASCHQPHGSSNPRMLTRHEVRLQCLECHANTAVQTAALGGVPPAIHDLRSPRFRNCTTCHQKVHGSHVNRMFLR
ncbi:MAG: DmsE family decaheme c-type cytochrome [Acidobacteria bacterium]|nr:DmsE family decaheme c-type cytochrome [Acidobacteriota bacterium]